MSTAHIKPRNYNSCSLHCMRRWNESIIENRKKMLWVFLGEIPDRLSFTTLMRIQLFWNLKRWLLFVIASRRRSHRIKLYVVLLLEHRDEMSRVIFCCRFIVVLFVLSSQLNVMLSFISSKASLIVEHWNTYSLLWVSCAIEFYVKFVQSVQPLPRLLIHSFLMLDFLLKS